MIFLTSPTRACSRRSLGGAIRLRGGSHVVRVGLIVPDTARIVTFSWISIMCVCLLSHTGAQYSATGYTKPSAEDLKVDAEEPQVVPQSL
ncbi:hypothetical protein JTB14_034952 [Gonioctena quinquepunctata]|nr:hypothetical protein JTB14_034952 [Gonioctena quinquepunctata]